MRISIATCIFTHLGNISNYSLNIGVLLRFVFAYESVLIIVMESETETFGKVCTPRLLYPDREWP